jgi:hypothetical protein
MWVIGAIVVALAVLSMGACNDASEPSHDETPTRLASEAEPAEDSAAEFLIRDLHNHFLGQFGRAWESLHPGQRAVIDRNKFTECNSSYYEPLPQLERITVLESFKEPIVARHVPERTSIAVTLRYTVSFGGRQQTSTATRHVIRHKGQWTTVAADAIVKAYEKGVCPQG